MLTPKGILLMGLLMTMVLYVYKTIVEPIIDAYADPTLTYSFPLVMGFTIVILYEALYPIVEKTFLR